MKTFKFILAVLGFLALFFVVSYGIYTGTHL